MRYVCKLSHVLATKMANRCTDSEEFCRRLKELKSKSKNQSSPVDIYIDDFILPKSVSMAESKGAKRRKLHHYRPKRQASNNWETMDCWRWEDTRWTKQVCGTEEGNVHSAGKLPFYLNSNSSAVMKKIDILRGIALKGKNEQLKKCIKIRVYP